MVAGDGVGDVMVVGMVKPSPLLGAVRDFIG